MSRFCKLERLPWLVVAYSLIVMLIKDCAGSDAVWKWECRHDNVSSVTRVPRCDKVHALEASAKATGLNECKLTCGEYSMLFPKPTGKTIIGKETVVILPDYIRLNNVKCYRSRCPYNVRSLMSQAFQNFQLTLKMSLQNQGRNSRQRYYYARSYTGQQQHRRHFMKVDVNLQTNEDKLKLDTDESYSLDLKTSYSIIHVTITAQTFFGARHALETLSQLTAYHDSIYALQIVKSAQIYDRPAYPYRGVLLDTSRNFYSVASIKRLITAMSYSKLNTFHWHITDSHSFPLQIKSVPNMVRYGAYSPGRVYTHADVRSILQHAASRGVRVLPEFDQPSHMGEGWQWGEKEGLGKLAVCVNREPWQKFCLEPPCGQINPINENAYDVLEKIFKELFELFQPDIFHTGGDEVNVNCWNTTKEIADWVFNKYGALEEKQYLDLWGLFLNKATAKIYKSNGDKKIPLILWTSKMTNKENLNTYLNPEKHIIQIWSSTLDENIASIAESGFKTIFTNWNTMYLDCGFGNWLVTGNNWCSPYKDWKSLYNNDPVKILENLNVTVTPYIKKNILGQEAPLWSEQVDESTSEGRIWPRAAALAERVWTNPEHDWREAEYRIIFHRQRLVDRGVKADGIQPLWCKQNDGHCYWDPSIQ